MQEFLAKIPWETVAPVVVNIVLVVLLPLMAAAARKWLKAKTEGEKQAALLRLVDIVYIAVEAAASKIPVANKLALALGKIQESLGRPLTEPESRTASEAFAAKAFEAKAPSLQIGRDTTVTGVPK